jgi:hypothetical protein
MGPLGPFAWKDNMASITCYPRVVHTVPAVYSSERCPCLVDGGQALLIRMPAILELAYGLFCELRLQFEDPCVAARGHCFLLLPVS